MYSGDLTQKYPERDTIDQNKAVDLQGVQICVDVCLNTVDT